MRPVHPCRCAPPAHQYGSVVGLPWVAQRYVGGPLRSGKAKGSDFEVAARRPEAAAAVVIGL